MLPQPPPITGAPAVQQQLMLLPAAMASNQQTSGTKAAGCLSKTLNQQASSTGASAATSGPQTVAIDNAYPPDLALVCTDGSKLLVHKAIIALVSGVIRDCISEH